MNPNDSSHLGHLGLQTRSLSPKPHLGLQVSQTLPPFGNMPLEVVSQAPESVSALLTQSLSM